MTSVIPHKRKNLFSKNLLSGNQDSDVFLLVSMRGFILSTLYRSEGLNLRADTSVSSIGKKKNIYIYISLESTFIYHIIVDTRLVTIRLKHSGYSRK